ncbi:energy transducer TonB [Urechidicola sp. KH5]
MKNKKHSDRLQKSSGLFMQLGLVLTLLTVYALFEHKTEKNQSTVLITVSSEHDTEFIMKDYKIEENKVEQTQDPQPRKEQAKLYDEIEEIDNDEKEKAENEILTKPESKESPDIERQLVDVGDEPEEFDDDTHLINTVQEVPIFPGCEKKKSKVDRRACFEQKVGRFINRRFDTSIAESLSLREGKQRIYVQFLINKNGQIEVIDARAPHKRLESEGKRVVDQLPQMTPGKQNGKPVKVSYMVPITFEIQ